MLAPERPPVPQKTQTILACLALDPDPDSQSGSANPLKSGSNPDPKNYHSARSHQDIF
jgi:hypothetical protein